RGGARGGGPRWGGADLGRLAVLRRVRRGTAGPGPGPVPRVLRRGAVQLRRAGLLALRLHLGGRRLCPGARSAPGLSQETRVDPSDQAASVPSGRRARRVRPGGGSAGPGPAAARRLARGGVTLREPWPDNGFVNAHPMAHHRWMPSIEKGAPDALDELIASGSASAEAGPAWRGDATLDLFDSPTEELARLGVREILAGYYRQVGVTWDGGKLLAERAARYFGTKRPSGGD